MNNIIEIDLSTNKRALSFSTPYQHDHGLFIRLKNAPESPDYQLMVEMCNKGDERVKYYPTYTGDDVEVPSDLLNDGRDLQCYISAFASDFFKTLIQIDVKIIRRPSR